MAASVGMRVLIGVVLSVVTGLGVGVASGSAGGDALQPAPPAAELRVELQNATFGTQTYTLTCSPAGGTMPNPPAVCSAIAAELALLVNPGELPLACTEATAVHVGGTYNDTPVERRVYAVVPGPRQAGTGCSGAGFLSFRTKAVWCVSIRGWDRCV